ncbi:MAG: redoxin domain-containing protein [Halobaculum sp.]
MSETADGQSATTPAPSFKLPNVGPGPDPFSLDAVGDDYDSVLLLFQRDYYCTKCRQQVRAISDRFDEFEAVGALPVSVLPESVDKTRSWQEKLDLPYPVLADPESAVGDEYDQPTRFGILGNAFDFVGRMPLAVVIDLDGEPTVHATYPGSSTFDRPDLDELLADCRAVRESE